MSVILIKFKIFLSLLLKLKFRLFLKKKNYKIVVIDDEEKSENKLLLEKHLDKVFFLTSRFYHLKYFYYNIPILINMVKYLFKAKFSLSNYYISLIKFIDPKIVLTTCDNSHHFFSSAKILHQKYRFIAIQRSTRDSVVFLPQKLKKGIFIPEYFCFGDYEKKFYKKIKAKILKYRPIGSYHYSNFENNVNTNKIKEIYDICLIAEVPYYNHKFDYNAEGKQLAHWIKKFAKKYNLRAVVAGKRTKIGQQNLDQAIKKNLTKAATSKHKFNEEYSLYTNILGTRNYFANAKDQFSSYKTAFKSRIIIGMSSTMLREMLSIGKKVLVWNSEKHLENRTKFPIKGLCYIQCNEYKDFEKRLKKIFKMPKKKYFSQLSDLPKNLVYYDKNKTANVKILEEIEKSLD